jgi:hypothetical protein
VLSVVGDVPACGDSVNLEDASTNFEDAPRGRVCVRVFVGMSVRVLYLRCIV